MHKTINIKLSQETINLIDRVRKRGGQSRIIDRAVKHYVREINPANLKKQLKEGAVRRAERDLHLAEEWFILEESWQERQK